MTMAMNENKQAGLDVYSYGVVASSTLYCTNDPFPGPDGYAEIGAAQYMTGGEAANSSLVLSRLGARVKLDGNWIGSDDAGRRTKALLERYHIDTSRLPLTEGYTGVHEVIIAAPGTRTIFGAYGELLQREDWNMPVADDIRQAKVINLDPFFAEASIQVAEIATAAGKPVITVDCLLDDPVLGCASAVVISESYIRWKYPERQPDELFQDYVQATDGLVVFTFGENDLWFGRRDEDVKMVPAFSVDAIDTTGAGDAFRSGVVFGHLKGWDDKRTVTFAAAVAAIVCTRVPGTLNAPSYDEVVGFLRSQQT